MNNTTAFARCRRVVSALLNRTRILTCQLSLRPTACVAGLVCAVTLLPLVGAAQVSLTNGWSNPGAIAAAGASNTWTVAANYGDRIILQVAKTSGGAGFSPRIEAFSPEGASLGSKSAGVVARLDLQAAVTGTYTISVRDANLTGTGEYQLYLARIPAPSTVPPGDNGGVLTNGANQQGVIGVGDLDDWTIPANGGDRLTIQVGEVSGGAGFTPMIELFSPTGAQLAVASGGLAARVDVQAEVAGNYTLIVSDAALTGSGTYELHLAQIPAAFVVPAGDEGGILPSATPTDGAILLGDLDLWTINAVAGERLSIQVTELTGGANFTPAIELFGPGGERRRAGQNGTTLVIDTATEVAGAYTLLVSDAAQTGAGTYRLELTRSAIAPGGANVLTNGTVHLGSISSSGQTNLWTFTASTGEAIVVRIGEISQTGTFTPRLRLFGPTGAQLVTSFGASAADVAYTATNSGTFTLAVDSTSTGTGTYRLGLAKTGSQVVISPNDEGGVLTNGVMQVGGIDLGDLDVWSFTASAGENIVVRMGELSAALSPQLRLYSPSGALLDSAFGTAATEVAVRATESGTFMVVAADQSSAYAGTGDYRLTLFKTGGPITTLAGDEGGVVTNGVTYVAGIGVGDLDAWEFIANAGQSMVLRMGENTASLTPQLRLYGPNGGLVDSAFGTVAAEVVFRATNSGRFTLIAGDLSSGFGGSGNYRLSLAKTGTPLTISAGDEGDALTNGATHLGSIDIGDIDAWRFDAAAGDSLIVRMGETSGTLTPQLRLYGPSGVLLDSSFGTAAAEVVATAAESGTFLVIAGDLSSGHGGAGNYRLSLARSGHPLTISANDEGGPMINGTTYLGHIDTGDIDAWAINASTGESIVARMGETTSGITPQLRLYSPTGVLLDSAFGTVATEVSTRTTTSGTFLLVASDLSSGYAGTGDYRLSVAKTGEPLLITNGDEGGSFSGAESYDGAIDLGDVDAWTFTARAGELISVNVTELVTGSPLTPQVRLFAPDGTLLRSFFGTATAQFSNYVAPANGTYMVVVGDFSSGYGGTGTYRMTVNGLSDGFKFYPPIVLAGDVSLLAVGGTPGAAFTLLTTTNLSTSLNLWTEMPYNLDQFGVADIQNLGYTEPQRFFLLRFP